MVNEEKQSEFLKTAGSFAEYMMKEYGQPKDGRSMLLIASDDEKSLVSFIGKKIDGCKSIVNVMLTNDDIGELLNVAFTWYFTLYYLFHINTYIVTGKQIGRAHV